MKKHITELDINFLYFQMSKLGWSQQYFNKVGEEYKKFLLLRSLNQKLSPANDVDAMWHQHILNTRHYREYCNNKFGKFVDHDPTDAFDQTARKSRLDSTICTYKKHYGSTPDCAIWPVKTENKKFIWYDFAQTYEDYKNSKLVIKIIFTLVHCPSSYNNSTIMYLASKDITLGKLSKIIYNRCKIKISDAANKNEIRWICLDKSYLNKTINDENIDMIFDGDFTNVENDQTNISTYFKNSNKLIGHYYTYEYPRLGC